MFVIGISLEFLKNLFSGAGGIKPRASKLARQRNLGNFLSFSILFSYPYHDHDLCCSGDGDPLRADRGRPERGPHDAPGRRAPRHRREDQAGRHPREQVQTKHFERNVEPR